MTGAQHHMKAQQLLAAATLDESGLPSAAHGVDRYIAAAQVHATLALALATALPPSTSSLMRAWCEAESES